MLFYAKSKTYYYDGTFLREAYAPATTAKGFNQVGDNPKRSLNPKGRNGGSVWQINNGSKRSDHPAPMPFELAERCVLVGCPVGGTVLDPFVGSGTTALACVQNQRHCTGIDLNRAYLEIAMKKVPGARIVTR